MNDGLYEPLDAMERDEVATLKAQLQALTESSEQTARIIGLLLVEKDQRIAELEAENVKLKASIEKLVDEIESPLDAVTCCAGEKNDD